MYLSDGLDALFPPEPLTNQAWLAGDGDSDANAVPCRVGRTNDGATTFGRPVDGSLAITWARNMLFRSGKVYGTFAPPMYCVSGALTLDREPYRSGSRMKPSSGKYW